MVAGLLQAPRRWLIPAATPSPAPAAHPFPHRNLWAAIVCLLLLSAFPAEGRRSIQWWVGTDDYDLGLYPSPISPIPPAGPRVPFRGTTRAEFAAYLADRKNDLFEHIRSTQDSTYWYAGRIEPIGLIEDHLDDPILWPGGYALTLALSDGRRVASREIIAMFRFRIDSPGCDMVRLYPSSMREITFRDLVTENKLGKRCIIYAAFPRTFAPPDVVSTALTPLSPSAAETDQSLSLTQPGVSK